jgi:hypothetical protein
MKGQVTGFAIIGVLLLIAAIGLTWLARLEPNTTNNTLSLDLETCIENEMLLAIKQIGLNGGVPSSLPILLVAVVDAAGSLGLPETTKTSRSLNPKYPDSIELHETDDLSANNRFFAFDTDPGTTVGSASSVFTSEITRRVASCENRVVELTITSISYSDTSTTLTASVIEEDRSPYEVTVNVPVPVRHYHQVLHQLLKNENTDPTFLLASPSPDFTIRSASTNNAKNDTLVMLETDRPLLGEEPFRYLTIIENRPPVYTEDLVGILECDDTSSPNIIKVHNSGGADTIQGLIDSDILIDPDDLHDPDITGCTVTGVPSYRFTIESGGKTYELEVPQ